MFFASWNGMRVSWGISRNHYSIVLIAWSEFTCLSSPRSLGGLILRDQISESDGHWWSSWWWWCSLSVSRMRDPASILAAFVEKGMRREGQDRLTSLIQTHIHKRTPLGLTTHTHKKVNSRPPQMIKRLDRRQEKRIGWVRRNNCWKNRHQKRLGRTHSRSSLTSCVHLSAETWSQSDSY